MLRTLAFFLLLTLSAQAAAHWATAWTASVQGPYPIGNPYAQPDLRFAFPTPENGARDQTFRLIVQPDIWGPQARLRFSNIFGVRPVTFDAIYAGFQWSAGAIVPGTNRPVRFSNIFGVRPVTFD